MYQPDETIRLEVRMDHETVWLTTRQMAILFGREESNIRRHVINVFKEKELSRENNVQILHVNDIKKPIPFYTLDVIISVGYRVKSQRGTDFRRWATKVLRNHLLNGYSLNQNLQHIKKIRN
ncbi:MAG: virulence RhuM family protein [Prevotella sp.]|nr:virulence RhuM family protein [Prevotella sp.]